MRCTVFKVVLIGLAIACLPCLALGQKTLGSETKSAGSSGDSGTLELSCETKLRRSNTAFVEYTFHDTSGSYWTYNFSFNPLLPFPGQLEVYDDHKKYLGGFLGYEMGSRRSPTAGDFVYMWDGTHLGAKIGFQPGGKLFEDTGRTRDPLAPGHYYIQLVLYRAFFSGPNDTENAGRMQKIQFDQTDGVRSNAIEIQLVD